MGRLQALWHLTYDPTDASNPSGVYTPYSFDYVANPSLTRDFARRESVLSIPGLDSVLDGNGRVPGPMDRADVTFAFTVFTNGDNDAAGDLLRAQVAPGYPQRLVYVTDSGAQWFTVGTFRTLKQTATSAQDWIKGGQCDFVVTWRIRPYWTPRFSEVAELFHAATTFAAGTTFGAVGTTTIAAAIQGFTIDARGTAGLDLPTIPDTGPTITIRGPCGGAQGIQVVNYNAQAADTAGTLQPVNFTLPFSLPTASESVTLNFASQSFMHTGLPFRPARPAYQREWFRVQNGVLNTCQVNALPLGGGGLTGGSINVNWTRKRA